MKKIFYSLLITSFLLSCDQPERNCQEYKTGTFSFNYIVNGEEKLGTFTRDQNYSVEYYDNKIDSAAVKWVNDCEFVLQDVKSKASVHMKILSTTDNSYTFEYSLVGDAKKIRGTALRTK
jgi:hypothetical protein